MRSSEEFALARGAGASYWEADQAYNTGGDAYTVNAVSTSQATDAAPPIVYQYNRYGGIGYYLRNLTPGLTYSVRLHFAETIFSAVGQREFNVLINGTQVLTNYDIFAHVGGRNIADVQAFTTTVGSDGRITIQTQAGAVDGPFIEGIEIVGGSSGTEPPGEYKISGHVKLGGTGVGLANASVTLSLGESDVTVTAADGSYSFFVYTNGSYTISAAVPGFTVTAPITIYSVTADKPNQDFTATLTVGGSLSPTSPLKEFIFINGAPMVVEHKH